MMCLTNSTPVKSTGQQREVVTFLDMNYMEWLPISLTKTEGELSDTCCIRSLAF